MTPSGVRGVLNDSVSIYFLAPTLASAFATSDAHVVTFDNPLQDRDASNTVYIGVKASLPL